MNRFTRRGAVRLLALVALFGIASLAFGQGKKSDSVVKITATADKPDADGKQVITVNIAIDPDWHLYANPVGNDTLTGGQTTITVKAATAPEVLKVEYPEGKLIKDKVTGDYKVYEGKVAIKVHVRRKGDGPLELAITLQSCNDKTMMCLLPATAKVKVP